jgi:hypothetical protein
MLTIFLLVCYSLAIPRVQASARVVDWCQGRAVPGSFREPGL